MHQNCIDHTKEVENRISAIKTNSRDTCSFYQSRDMCLTVMKECWYCRYASFDVESQDPFKPGFCKYNKL